MSLKVFGRSPDNSKNIQTDIKCGDVRAAMLMELAGTVYAYGEQCYPAAAKAAAHVLGAPESTVRELADDPAGMEALMADCTPGALADDPPDGEGDCPCKDENKKLKEELAELRDQKAKLDAEIFEIKEEHFEKAP